MLYLEDYIELIEHLPKDIKEKLTDMRDQDMKVQNGMENLDTRVSSFFSRAKRLSNEDREKEYNNICAEYQKMSLLSADKMSSATKLNELFSKHISKLDQELAKFKLELEADNAGITEILEKRSLEMDNHNKPIAQSHIYQKYANAHLNKGANIVASNLMSNATKRLNKKYLNQSYRPLSLGSGGGLRKFPPLRVNQATKSSSTASPSNSPSDGARSSTSNLHQQLQNRYRKTNFGSNTKVSDAKSNQISENFIGNLSHLGNDYNDKHSGTNYYYNSTTGLTPSHDYDETSSTHGISNALLNGNREIGEEEILEDDPNEPRYCVCQQVSYGEMVACDNPTCPYEWFHYACVGISQPPRGKWFCPECSVTFTQINAVQPTF